MGYIDEDVLYTIIEEKYKSATGGERKAYSDVLDTICEMPRVDVEHKRHNAFTIGVKAGMQMAKDEARAKVAREIFEEIYEDCFDPYGYLNYGALDELAKKYTEEKK